MLFFPLKLQKNRYASDEDTVKTSVCVNFWSLQISVFLFEVCSHDKLLGGVGKSFWCVLWTYSFKEILMTHSSYRARWHLVDVSWILFHTACWVWLTVGLGLADSSVIFLHIDLNSWIVLFILTVHENTECQPAPLSCSLKRAVRIFEFPGNKKPQKSDTFRGQAAIHQVQHNN